MWCWWRLLRVPWTGRRSNHSILKEISPGCSLEGMMLKLYLQYFGHLMRRVDSLEKTLMLGGIEGRRRRRRQRIRRLDGITDSTDIESEWTVGVDDGQGCLVCCDSWGRKEWDTTELNWTELSVSMWLKGEWGAEALCNLFSVSSIKGARGLDALWKTLCVLYLSVKSKIQWLWQNM